MTEYEEGWPYPVAFPPGAPGDDDLGGDRRPRGCAQLHVAETEKYPHVTYFFNGGEEQPCAGERRELVPSPRDVPTYDHKPEMSAREAASAFVDAWRSDSPTFGIINFANADMVGHTGVIEAAVRGDRDRRRLPGGGGQRRALERRRVPDHRRPRQRRPHARAGRQPEHGPLAEPGAGDRHRPRDSCCGTGACWPTWRRRCCRCWGSSSRREMTGRSLIS